jgi:protein-L-isoaspartate O-methyltransferase
MRVKTLLYTSILLAISLASGETDSVPREEFSQGPRKVETEQQKLLDHPNWLAPFVPTPFKVVRAILKLAKVRENDLVYDLGSGDGRIIIMAAQKFHARAVGIEFDENLYQKATAAIQQLRLEERVKLIQGDIFNQNLSPATVVTVYLLPRSLEKIAPLLEKQLSKGTRVVTVDGQIQGWTWVRKKQVKDKARATPYNLYLYEVGVSDVGGLQSQLLMGGFKSPPWKGAAAIGCGGCPGR